MGLVALRRAGAAVAAQVRHDDGEVTGELAGHSVPHRMGLGITVQQQERRTRPAGAVEDIHALAARYPRREAWKEIVVALHRSLPDQVVGRPSSRTLPGRD